MSKNFAIIGCAGYVAPRHLKAIKDTGNRLIAAVDPHDSVGVLDQHFDNVSFFTEFERFDRHIEKLRREGEDKKIDYISICSPNYLHDAHVRFALRVGADAICEKPLVIKPWNVDALLELENECDNKVNTVLQLRHHNSIIEMREKINKQRPADKYDIVLTYITPRGPWYHYSWKGNIEQSGGLATNIGVHFYDLLIWLFGSVENSEVHISNSERISGYLELEKARIRWYLSINKGDLPESAKSKKIPSFRSLTMNGEEIEFSGGFTDLHTVVYQEILEGRGYGLADVRPSVELVHSIREFDPMGVNNNSHPFLKK
jgi:UDP-N-acetyl-2-amino-2-deoxyglucuronate dehydrogenase